MKIEMKPMSMPEAKKLVETVEGEDGKKEIRDFLKKFTKLKEKEAEEMRRELEALGLMKIKEEHLVKVIDLLPEDASDINKIFVDVGLNEDEINKMLEIIKRYR
ncbi:MAG: hypothetical protein AABX71_03380 [Nanoarchaeota archaeon]